jgi:tyrosinase
MSFISAFVASLFAFVALGSPTSPRAIDKRQSLVTYAITGAIGGVNPRLEIRDLQKTGEMWNLYLLAMTEFQAMDQSKIDSYYQIGGIHGMPW